MKLLTCLLLSMLLLTACDKRIKEAANHPHSPRLLPAETPYGVPYHGVASL